MSDRVNGEPEGLATGNGSFVPPITPPVPGTPGPNQYLQSDAGGVVAWAPKPAPGTVIPSGTGWVKQTAPGTFGSFSSVPAPEVSYSPAVPANWLVSPSDAATALDLLASAQTTLTPRTWYVNGGSAPSGNGSFRKPFLTVAAGLAAAAAGDLVLVAPGTYVENIVLPNLDNVQVRGAGKYATTIKAATGSTTPTVKWAPVGGTYSRLTLRDLTIQNLEAGAGGEAGRCLSIDGNGTAITVSGDQVAQFMTTGLILDKVIIDKGLSAGDGYYFRAVDKIYVSEGNGSSLVGNPSGWNCSGQWLNVGYAFVSGTSLGNGVTAYTYEYDYTIGVVKATNGRQGFNLLNGTSMYGTTTLQKCPLVGAASDVAFYGDIIATALTMSTAPMRAPAIRIASTIGSPGAPAAITITSPAMTPAMVAAGAITYVDLSGARVWNSGTKRTTMAGTAGGALRFNPIARGAVFDAPGELVATTKVFAGAACDFDIRGSYFKQSSLSQVAATDGTIDRDSWSVGPVNVATVQPITPPFPAGASLTATVTPTSDVAVGATVTPTALTIGGGGTAQVNARVQRNA